MPKFVADNQAVLSSLPSINAMALPCNYRDVVVVVKSSSTFVVLHGLSDNRLVLVSFLVSPPLGNSMAVSPVATK